MVTVHATRIPTVSQTKPYRRVSPRELIAHTLAHPPPTRASTERKRDYYKELFATVERREQALSAVSSAAAKRR